MYSTPLRVTGAGSPNKEVDGGSLVIAHNCRAHALEASDARGYSLGIVPGCLLVICCLLLLGGGTFGIFELVLMYVLFFFVVLVLHCGSLESLFLCLLILWCWLLGRFSRLFP